MKKEEQASLVHDLGLGKRQRHADKTGQPLPQGVIPTFDVSSFSGLFAHCYVLLLRDHCPVCCPKVCKTMSLAVGWWNGFPQPLTRLFAPITQRIGNHLTRLAAESDPNPRVVCFFQHKRPEFVQFQYRGSRIFQVWGNQGGT